MPATLVVANDAAKDANVRTAVEAEVGRGRSRAIEHNRHSGVFEEIDERYDQVALGKRADRVAIGNCHRVDGKLIAGRPGDRSERCWPPLRRACPAMPVGNSTT